MCVKVERRVGLVVEPFYLPPDGAEVGGCSSSGSVGGSKCDF
jgi:hypothetical protein